MVHSETARCLTPTVGASKSTGREGSQSKDFKRYPVQSSPRIIWGLSCDISLCHLIARSAQGLLFAIELFLCSWFTCELHSLSILCRLLSQLALSNFSVVRKPKMVKSKINEAVFTLTWWQDIWAIDCWLVDSTPLKKFVFLDFEMRGKITIFNCVLQGSISDSQKR